MRFGIYYFFWLALLVAAVFPKQSFSGHYPVFEQTRDKEDHLIQEVIVPITKETPFGPSVVLFEDDNWLVMRHHPTGYLDISYREDSQYKTSRIDALADWRRHIHPMLIARGNQGDLFIAAYDVIDNSPSGRSLKQVISGIDLYRIKAQPVAKPEKLAKLLPIAGIDTVVYGSFANQVSHLCGENRCFSVNATNEYEEWNLKDLRDFEFVELAFDNDRAAALLRRRHDNTSNKSLDHNSSIYSLAVFDKNGATIYPFKEQGIPWRIKWRDDKLIYNLARSRSELQQVFYYDLGRMPLHGVMDFGANNIEGRVAWSQVYYLNGLLSILTRQVPHLYPAESKLLRHRVTEELRLLNSLCLNDYPGLRVKRYSLDREPLLFALHLGRTASLLKRATEANIQIDFAQSLAQLRNMLISLDLTVEELVSIPLGANKVTYLRYRPGLPFWADGSNVPYNYVSGYAEGLLSLEFDNKILLQNLLQPLLTLEFEDPTARVWRYWWGTGDKGWTVDDCVSHNTPTYQGNNKSIAHITYRTMDAKALLKFSRKYPGILSKSLVQHFRQLTAEGWLLPYLNEIWLELGGIVRLQDSVAMQYARSAAVWEIQGQVWALNQLSEDAKDD